MSDQQITSSNLYALIMAGGQGTRFWPESTSKTPKQYLKLLNDNSLLYDTLERFSGLVSNDKRYIVTIKDQEKLAKENSKKQIGEDNFIYEPSGRNTAPCVLLSLASLMAQGASLDDVVVIAAADHVILNQQGFRDTIKDAFETSYINKQIVTIGIRATFPHTGYGYIKKGQTQSENTFIVEEFKEKPSLDIAKEYVASGEYFWNAGMFVSPIGVLLEEFEEHAPEWSKYYDLLRDNYFNEEKINEIYSKIPVESLDYAVMEKSKRIMVTPANFDWNDLGSWDALESVIEKKDSNTIVKDKGYYFDGADGNIIFAPNQFVSLVNVNDLIIVSNDNALVVLPKKDSQKVKKIVEYLKENNKELV